MNTTFLIEATAYLAGAQAGSEKMSNNLRQAASDKWEKSKQLPRKAKKLMRKDAKLDWAFSEWNDDFLPIFQLVTQ